MGVLFSYDPALSAYEALVDFDGITMERILMELWWDSTTESYMEQPMMEITVNEDSFLNTLLKPMYDSN